MRILRPVYGNETWLERMEISYTRNVKKRHRETKLEQSIWQLVVFLLVSFVFHFENALLFNLEITK